MAEILRAPNGRPMTPRERRLKAESAAREASRLTIVCGATFAPANGPLASQLIDTDRSDVRGRPREEREASFYLSWFGSQGPTGAHGFTGANAHAEVFDPLAPATVALAVDALDTAPYMVRWDRRARMFTHREDAIGFARHRNAQVFHVAPKMRKVAEQTLQGSDPRTTRDAGPRKGPAMVVGGMSSRVKSHYACVGTIETRIFY